MLQNLPIEQLVSRYPAIVRYSNIIYSQRWLLIGPICVSTAVAFLYAITRSPTWTAWQAILVRDEAIGSVGRQGSFESTDKLKAFQETVLEVARNPTVVRAALQAVGPPGKWAREGWPGDEDVKSLQASIKVNAPRGAEFGKTEVIYLTLSGRSAGEALQRTTAICDQLEKHLAELRDARAAGLVAEQERTLGLAQQELDGAIERLKQIEREVGLDLGDLRALSEVGSGDGSLKVSVNQIRTELRQAQLNLESQKNVRQMLATARQDPDSLLATTGRLLDSQPTLKKLREGLVEAQLNTARLQGNRTANHPAVIAAKRSEARVREDFLSELDNSIRGADAETNILEKQVESLERQLAEAQTRLDRLASLRAPYGSLASDVRQREAIVEKAKRELADAQARRSAASASSLLTRFQDPVAGDRPVGLGRTTIVAGGFGSGLALGAGLVALFWPGSQQSRRWNDILDMGRRATDRLMRRRASDRTTQVQSNGPTSQHRRATDPAPTFGRRSSDVLPDSGRRASDHESSTPAGPCVTAARSDTPSEK